MIETMPGNTGNQRWLLGRDSYRPPSEVIVTSEYEVTYLQGDKQAKEFVTTHHYSRTYPASRFRYGLFKHGILQGVAVFSVPMQNRVITNVFPGNPNDFTELGRFVLLDEVPGNGETWFLARCFEDLKRRGILGVISFSDPMPRTTFQGEVIFPGHLGTIYQAFNGRYLGRGAKTTLNLLPDGRNFSPRAVSKLLNKEVGWEYALQQLLSAGARPPEHLDQIREWYKVLTTSFLRRVRHLGNHKYAWALNRRQRKFIEVVSPYPKTRDPLGAPKAPT